MAGDERDFTLPEIVTIDDDPVTLNVVYEMLKGDYSVRPFSSGRSALKYLSNNVADLILLDANMPMMNGFEVLESLKSHQNTMEIPVIFLTGADDEDSETKALENGAADYLTKPIRPQVAMRRIRHHLDMNNYKGKLEELVIEKVNELNKANTELINRANELSLLNEMLSRREHHMIGLLAKASDMRDHDTGEHIERSTLYTKLILNHILKNPKTGYAILPESVHQFAQAAKLHDIGKIATPDNILLKTGRLEPHEFDVIKRHPIDAAKLLLSVVPDVSQDAMLAEVFNVTVSHHEKWDGSGYPFGLAGAEIPLSARIVAIADVYDALTSKRPYKKAFDPVLALNIIYDSSGSHFDPYLVSIVKLNETRMIDIASGKEETHTFGDVYNDAKILELIKR